MATLGYIFEEGTTHSINVIGTGSSLQNFDVDFFFFFKGVECMQGSDNNNDDSSRNLGWRGRK